MCRRNPFESCVILTRPVAGQFRQVAAASVYRSIAPGAPPHRMPFRVPHRKSSAGDPGTLWICPGLGHRRDFHRPIQRLQWRGRKSLQACTAAMTASGAGARTNRRNSEPTRIACRANVRRPVRASAAQPAGSAETSTRRHRRTTSRLASRAVRDDGPHAMRLNGAGRCRDSRLMPGEPRRYRSRSLSECGAHVRSTPEALLRRRQPRDRAAASTQPSALQRADRRCVEFALPGGSEGGDSGMR